MANDTTDVVVNDANPGFEPEPVPDNLADIELAGLQPSDESTDSDAVETDQAETTEEPAEADESETDSPSAEDEQTNSETEDAEPQQQPDPKEQARQMYQQRQARRDYVAEQRQQIRDYQSQNDMSDIQNRQDVLEAQLYLDTVERNRRDAVTDYTRAANEIPFYKETPQGQAALATAIQEFNNAYAVVDPESGEYLGAQDRNGNPVSLYNYLANEAARFETIIGSTQQVARQEGQREAQRAEAKMRAKVVQPSNPGKVTSSGDELEDLLEKVGDIPLN